MNLDEAMKKHGDWKIKFHYSIANKTPMEPALIARDNCCQLGNWLYGEAKEKYGSLPEYHSLLTQHKQFHIEAGKIAELINAGCYEAAEAALQENTAYSVASKSIGVAIFRLKKIIA
ncbi:MAG TPA: CZB domain-containing protein [Pseudomonadales bacterium]|nr:CZB domain-containing protein [Pseudomonadales bacterium]